MWPQRRLLVCELRLRAVAAAHDRVRQLVHPYVVPHRRLSTRSDLSLAVHQVHLCVVPHRQRDRHLKMESGSSLAGRDACRAATGSARRRVVPEVEWAFRARRHELSHADLVLRAVFRPDRQWAAWRANVRPGVHRVRDVCPPEIQWAAHLRLARKRAQQYQRAELVELAEPVDHGDLALCLVQMGKQQRSPLVQQQLQRGKPQLATEKRAD